MIPPSEFQTTQNWNDFVNEFRFWTNRIETTLAQIQTESGVSADYVDKAVSAALTQAKTYTDNALSVAANVESIAFMLPSTAWQASEDGFTANFENSAITAESTPFLVFDDDTLEAAAPFGVLPVCETKKGALTLSAVTLPTVDMSGTLLLIGGAK